MNEILKALYERKSVRVFTEQDITGEEKETILQAALQAPSAGCQLLYTILDITDQHKKEQLALLCDNQPFIGKAKMVLVFCADCRKWLSFYREAGLDPRLPGPGDLLLAVEDALIAAQNAVTAAQFGNRFLLYRGCDGKRGEDAGAACPSPVCVSGLYAGVWVSHQAAAGAGETQAVCSFRYGMREQLSG